MSNLTVFKLLAKYAPYQLFRYAMDWNKQLIPAEIAVEEWEAREPNSLEGVMHAYAYLLPLIEENKIFCIEDIKTIHTLCMQNVVTTPYNMEKTAKIPLAGEVRGFGKWRGGLFGRFALTVQTYSEQGLIELLQSHDTGDCHCENFSHIPTDLSEILQHLKKYGCYEVSGYRAKFSWEDLREITQAFENQAPLSAYEIRYNLRQALSSSEIESSQLIIDRELARWQHNFIDKLNEVFATFYQELHRAHNDDEKLTAIVNVVRKLEIMHPFWDGNCRTFCIILLNALLMQNGFAPCLFDDPNKFDGYSISELVTLVKEGIERTDTLCAYVMSTQSDPSFFSSTHLRSTAEVESDNWMLIHPSQHTQLARYAEPLTNQLNALSPTITETEIEIELRF